MRDNEHNVIAGSHHCAHESKLLWCIPLILAGRACRDMKPQYKVSVPVPSRDFVDFPQQCSTFFSHLQLRDLDDSWDLRLGILAVCSARITRGRPHVCDDPAHRALGCYAGGLSGELVDSLCRGIVGGGQFLVRHSGERVRGNLRPFYTVFRADNLPRLRIRQYII